MQLNNIPYAVGASYSDQTDALQYASKPSCGALIAPKTRYEQSSRSRLQLTAFYRPEIGGLRTIRIGSQSWHDQADMARITGLDRKTLERIAGRERTMTLPDAHASHLPDNDGGRAFIRADACRHLIASMRIRKNDFRDFPLDDTDIWSPKELLALDGYVRAATLRRYIGGPRSFHGCTEFLRNHGFAPETSCAVYENACGGLEVEFPVLVARALAARLETVESDLALVLLTNGGYLHGGHAGENAEQTLVRFFGLLPDYDGMIGVHQMWEFENCPYSFDDWYHHHLSSPEIGISNRIPFDSDCGLEWEFRIRRAKDALLRV